MVKMAWEREECLFMLVEAVCLCRGMTIHLHQLCSLPLPLLPHGWDRLHQLGSAARRVGWDHVVRVVSVEEATKAGVKNFLQKAAGVGGFNPHTSTHFLLPGLLGCWEIVLGPDL